MIYPMGPHVERTTGAAVDWAKVAPVVKGMQNVSILQSAHDGAIQIYRHYSAIQNLDDPQTWANAIISDLAGYRATNLIVEVWNETKPTPAQVKALVDILHRAGLKVCGPCWSTGNYTLADWQAFRAAHWAGLDLIALHAYWGQLGFTIDHALRFTQYWQPGDPCILVTECGRDAVEGGQGGWERDNISAQQYEAELQSYAKILPSYVIGATPFTSGPTSDWNKFDMDIISPSMPALLNQGANVPNVGQGYLKCIPFIGTFTQNEIYHDSGQPDETSMALATNGFAVYRKSTNETMCYTLDGKVYRDFGNHSTNGGKLVLVSGPF